MRRFRTWAALVLAAVLGLGIWASTWGDEGSIASLQNYVEQHQNAKLLMIGDSWMHGDSYAGKNVNPDTGRPYNWAAVFADSSACQGNEFGQQLARRLNTTRWGCLSVGSMELMLGTTGVTTRAQQDSSIFGLMRPYYAELYDPDIVVLPGGGGYNDIVAGSTYAQLRVETIATAKRAIDVFGGTADWIVWIGPRPIGIYHYTRLSSGTDAQRQVLAAAEYVLWEKFSTFVSDTLRTELAAAGYRTNRFVTFDSRPYSTIADTDTAETFEDADKFETTTQAQYDVVKAIRWSPSPWIRTESSKFGIHMTDYGNKCYADSLAQHLFGVTLSDTYTKGSGRTIFMSYNTGHNHLNRMRCTERGYPLKSLQAAVNQAHPGDIVRVIGTGNQASVAYEVSGDAKRSALQYEATVKQPGITILLEPGAYFSGVYDNDTTIPSGASARVGDGLLSFFACTAGTALDSLSHDAIGTYVSVKKPVDLDLTITGTGGGGNWISGYQTPLAYYNYDRMTFKHLLLTGGASTNGSIDCRNYGGADLHLQVEDCTFYPDSASVSGNGRVLVRTYDGSSSFALDDSTSFSGSFIRCSWYGLASVTNVSAFEGPLSGFDFIECYFTDPNPYTRWVTDGTSVTVPTGLFDRTRFINCEWYTTETDASNTHNAVYWANTVEDTTYFINCSVYAPNITTINIWDAGTQGTGAEVYAAGSAFVKAELGTTDLTAAAAGAATTVTDGYSIRSYNTKSLGLTGDTLRFGGVQSFAGYDLTDHFGISHPTKTASIGPVQYGYDPLVWTSGAVQGRPSAATMAGPWEILKFVNAGVMATSTSTDPSTWFEIPRIYDESSLAVARSFLDAWEKWPAANQAKVRFKVSGEPVTTITAADGSVYQTLGALDAAITATTESASDSLTASTWFTLPRPYNLNAAFQIEILRAWHRTLAEANRKKIRLRVSGTDYSLAQPDTTYSNGLWAALKAITTGAETASDSLNDATWFMSSRVYDMAQAQQYGLYRDAWVGWPVATRQKVRMKTK